MPEPTSTATATVVVATAAVPVLTAFGVPLGLRPDLLLAGFSGSLAAIALLNSVPADGDTWPQLVRTSLRRLFVMLASSLTAGYLAPLVMMLSQFPDTVLYSGAFVVGGGAHHVLRTLLERMRKGLSIGQGEGA